MPEKDFQIPQRQSEIGVLLIFLQVVYNFFRGFWVLLVAVLFSSSLQLKIYIFSALLILGVLAIIYSFLYYRNFLFHLDYEKEKFVLEKGVFSSESIRIPFDRIQQVDLKRSILQRIIGVYGLKIDTAGSKGEEIHIRALSENDARKISAILTRFKDLKEEKTEEISSKEETEVSNEIWTHRVSFLTLLKMGLTRSYLRGFLLIMAFIISLYNQIQDAFTSYADQINTYGETFISQSSENTFQLIFILSFGILLSVIVTVGEVLIKHFNLNLQQNPEYLEIEMGLKTNTKVSFQAKRLQVLRIITNPIQKTLNLYEAHFSLAGSEDSIGKSKIIAPGLNPEILEKIKSFLYDHPPSKHKRFYNPHLAWLNRRFIVLGIISLIIAGLSYFQFGSNHQIFYFFMLGLGLAILIPYQYFIYKSIKLKIHDNFLIIDQGLWTQKTEIIELYKMEGVSLKQPFWYRRRNIYNLIFHTAGGDIKIRALPSEFLEEINFMLYKIESSERAWM